MLSKRKIILIAVIVAFLAILPVCAEDANSTDVSSEDNLQIPQEDVVSSTHTVTGNTFDDIQDAIDNANEGDTIELSGNYTGNGREININKPLNIQGNGKTILDANKKSGIFSVSGKNTKIINLHIFNTNDTAIHSSEINSFVCLNCTFINNTAQYGGAIKWGSAENCTFINNSANYGASMYECNAVNCTFIENHASHTGGAVYDVDAVNCKFIDNHARYYGGAMAFGDAINSTFIRNSVGEYGGAMYFGDADRCIFINNSDGSGGWTSDYFYMKGDAIYKGTAIYCHFEGNEIPSMAYCYAKLDVNQSGQYYKDKSLVIKLIETDSKLPLGGIAIRIMFSNGKSTKVTTDSKGIAIYRIPFAAGIYCATVTVDSQYVTVDDAGLDNILIERVPGTLEMNCSGDTYGNVTLTFRLSNSDLVCGTSTYYDYETGVYRWYDPKIYFSEETIEIRFSNGKSATVITDSNGIATYSVPFGGGVYSAFVSVSGDNIIIEDARLDNIVINKIPVNLDMFVGGSYQRAVTVVLLDANFTNPVSGEKVEIRFSNGKSAVVTTDSIGVASYSVPFAPGHYILTANLLSERFAAGSKSVSVNIIKATAKLTASKKTFKLKAKSKKYTITLNDDFAQPIKNAMVTIKVNGKTYKAKTNSMGKATFKITKLKKKGRFKATVRYAGDNYYNPVIKKVTIIVKK